MAVHDDLAIDRSHPRHLVTQLLQPLGQELQDLHVPQLRARTAQCGTPVRRRREIVDALRALVDVGARPPRQSRLFAFLGHARASAEVSPGPEDAATAERRADAGGEIHP